MIDTLYHGSPIQNICLLVPKCFTSRDPKEDKVIFASPLISLASCFMLNWNDTWVNLLINKEQIYLTTSNITRLEDNDRGGSIYYLSSKDFQFDAGKGLGQYEYYTKHAQIPLIEHYHSSSLAAMCSYGVKITSLTEENYCKFTKFSFLEKLDFVNKSFNNHFSIN